MFATKHSFDIIKLMSSSTASDQRKAVTAIKVLIQTCKAARDSIVNHPQSTESPPLSVVHKDLLSLLSLVHGTVTKLSLALKPSSPAYSACLVPLKELSDRIAAISHCANLFNATIHGATLVKEVLSVAINVVETVQTLATVFLEIEDSGERSRSADEYLMRTGAVHCVIEIARSEDGLPEDNLTAVRRHWLKDAGALQDGVREVGDMIEDAQAEIDTDCEDGWNELGIEPSKPLTDKELKIAKKVLTVLRLCNLLHQKVISDILRTTDSLSNSFLDNLASSSPALLSTSDELISTLDSPQDPDSITTELNVLKGVIDGIRTHLSILDNQPNSLAVSRKGTFLNEVSVPTNPNSRGKWFKSCFDQLTKAINSVLEAANET
ncbi:hypothetical protein J3R30DRAFT_3432406 [Lentinula aciculospora]|uniref:Grap2 and cyclin-D-interacting-domain-containing protein n=1 Tax=Lentinula aciculospora TaxID=153920 RepID=A0A9W9DWV6_9AGAR|nr:hypothetical protein J3R30DRAFT_3432406 [Lentinula aciculospora]